MRNIENEVLLKPAMKLLDKIGIRYIHIQKSRTGKFDSNKKLIGFPDLAIMLPKKILFVEFKIDKTKKLSDEQQKWKDYLIENDYDYKLITDFKEFEKIKLF